MSVDLPFNKLRREKGKKRAAELRRQAGSGEGVSW